MKTQKRIFTSALKWVLPIVGIALAAAEQKALSNADVLKMVKAGLPESTVVLAVQNCVPSFDLNPDALIALKSEGVSPAVIEAMLLARGQPKAKDKAPEPPGESDVETILKQMATEQSRGIVAVESFKKINGQRMQEKGVHVYKMEFEAIVRFGADCIWRHIHLESALAFDVAVQPSRFSSAMEEVLFLSTNLGVQVRRGSVYRFRGVARLEESEKGWIPTHFTHQGIEETSAAAIAGAAAEKNAKRLSGVDIITRDALAKLFESAVSPAEASEEAFAIKAGKVKASCPAGFKVEHGGSSGIIGSFTPPKGATAYTISVTCGPTPLLNRNQTLSETVRQTVGALRSGFPGASISETVKTTLAGAEAEAFAATVVENGKVVQKVFTIAVAQKHILGVVLHSSPDALGEAWSPYRQVCGSYALAVK